MIVHTTKNAEPESPETHASPDQVYDAFLNELPCDLHQYIVDEPFGGAFFDHPFMFILSFQSFICANVISPSKLVDNLAAKRAMYDALCLEAEFDAALYLVEKRHRREYLLDLVNEHGVEPLLHAIRSVWVEVDFISADYWLWDKVWSDVAAIKGGRRRVIDPEDLPTFDALPDTLTVYRGFQDSEGDESEYGWSWTLSRKTAEWFARRWSTRGAPLVATATISKDKILAYFNGRNEQEVVLHPEYLGSGLIART